MLPVKHVKKFDPDGTRTRIVFQSRPMPEQALTVGPRITEAERSKLVQALLSPEADSALARVRKDYGLGQNFVAADSQQYVGLARYLKDMRGF
jgi:ABC-type phosphate/phosphonate transport system substrate-binding protein